MRSQWILNRYRKWCRKAFRKSDPKALMKWKYWHKLYGEHELLWEQDPGYVEPNPLS